MVFLMSFQSIFISVAKALVIMTLGINYIFISVLNLLTHNTIMMPFGQGYVGPLKGGSPCRMSNGRNGDVPCHLEDALMSHV